MAVVFQSFNVCSTATDVHVSDDGKDRVLRRRGWFPPKPFTTADRADLRDWAISVLPALRASDAVVAAEKSDEDIARRTEGFLTWIQANRDREDVSLMLRPLIQTYRAEYK